MSILSNYLPSVSSVWPTETAPVGAFANEVCSDREPFVFSSARHNWVVGSHVKIPWSGKELTSDPNYPRESVTRVTSA